MDWLDVFLSGFHWYRRHRGGTWAFIMHKRIPGSTGVWLRNVNPTEDEIVLLINDFS